VSRIAVVRPKDAQLSLAHMRELLKDATKGLSTEEQQRRFNANLRAQELAEKMQPPETRGAT
jgi:hypothetical protein